MAEPRQATASGRPFGGDGFVERLERTLGRKLNPKRTGRPKEGRWRALAQKVVACPSLSPISHCSVSALVAGAHEDRDELLTAESRCGNREAHQLEAFFSGLV